MKKQVKMNYYTIKDLETLSGIKAHTIRIWEKRYGLLSPHRPSTNIRYYSDEELKRLLNVSVLVRHGFKISKVSGFKDDRINKEVLKLNQTPALLQNIIDKLVIHIINFDEEQFESMLNQQIGQYGFEHVMLETVFPLFEKIGVFWQVGSIFPAHEHFVSDMLRRRLISESAAFHNYQASKTFLFYLPENELHELSLLFYNYQALKYGHKTIYLGQNVPFDDLPGLADLTKIDFVFTVFINAIEKEELEAYFLKLNQVFGQIKVFVTGAQVINHEPRMPLNFNLVSSSKPFKLYLENI